MKHKGIGYNIHPEGYNIIKKMFQVITSDPPEIIDLKSFELNLAPEDIVFTYGPRAHKACLEKKCQCIIEFPDIERLDKELGEAELRDAAHHKLLELKKNLAQYPTKVITNEALPSLTADQVKEIEKQVRDRGDKYWTGITKDGRSVRITVQPEEGSADINLTFAELYAIRLTQEVLHIKELEIAHSSRINNQVSS